MDRTPPLIEALESRRLLSVSIGSIAAVEGHRVRLTAQDVSASPGDAVKSVTYFLDNNHDGALDHGDKVIGASRSAAKDFAVTRLIRPGPTSNIVTVSAVARGKLGKGDVSPVVTRDVPVRTASNAASVDAALTEIEVAGSLSGIGDIGVPGTTFDTGAPAPNPDNGLADNSNVLDGAPPATSPTSPPAAIDSTGGVSSILAPPDVTVGGYSG